MSNKSKKFKVKYIINIEGVSRAFPGDDSFQERLIDKLVLTIGSALENRFKTLKIGIKRSKLK